jgi:hypothetical protein
MRLHVRDALDMAQRRRRELQHPGPARDWFAGARTMQRATQLLRRRDPALTWLVVALPPNPASDETRWWFPQFVTALDGHPDVASLLFYQVPFSENDDDGVNNDDDSNENASSSPPRWDDLERLFGSVLPQLPRLRHLSLYECTLSARCAQLLGGAAGPASVGNDNGGDNHDNGGDNGGGRPLLDLDWVHTRLTTEACHAVARALRRGALANVKIVNAGLDSDGAALLLQAAADSPTLRGIELHEALADPVVPWAVTERAWAGGAMRRSRAALQSLVLDVSWTRAGLVELFRQLRTNTSLQVLDVRGSGADERLLFMMLQELLSTYNFTISRVGDATRLQQGQRPRVDALLRRNEGVRNMIDRLQSRNYHVPDPSLWPIVMGEIGTFPTLVYRFLRRGNGVVALSDRLRSMPHVAGR